MFVGREWRAFYAKKWRFAVCAVGFMADGAARSEGLPRVAGLHVFDKGHIVFGVLGYAGQVFRSFILSPLCAVKGEK